MKYIFSFLILLVFIKPQIKEISQYSEKNGFLFLLLSDVTTTKNNIYISDMLGFTISKIDKNNHTVTKTGRKGNGPGEFKLGPVIILTVNEKIYVMDGLLSNVYEYDSDLNFIKKYTLNDFNFSLFYYKNTFYGTTPNYTTNSHDIIMYNQNFNEMKRIKLPPQSKSRMLNSIELAFTNDEMYVFYKYKNIILECNLDGEIKREIRIKEFPREVRLKKNDKLADFHSDNQDLANLPTGENMRQVFIKEKSFIIQNSKNEVFIFDFNGKLLKKIFLAKTTKFKYDIKHMEDNGLVYLWDKDESILKIVKW